MSDIMLDSHSTPVIGCGPVESLTTASLKRLKVHTYIDRTRARVICRHRRRLRARTSNVFMSHHTDLMYLCDEYCWRVYWNVCYRGGARGEHGATSQERRMYAGTHSCRYVTHSFLLINSYKLIHLLLV